MIRTSQSIEVVTFTSSMRPDVSTEIEAFAETIEWADANPVAYRIVTATRSAVFGRCSAEYLGCDQGGNDSARVVARLNHFRQRLKEEGIFGWRARFTLAHYEAPGFRGDLFRLWDGEYLRSSIHLDYTPATLEAVLDQFVAWCDPYYRKVEVRIGKRVVRRFEELVVEEVDPLS
jgi:hypothetical protein